MNKTIRKISSIAAAVILTAACSTSCGTMKKTSGQTETSTSKKAKESSSSKKTTDGKTTKVTASAELAEKISGEWQIIKAGNTVLPITDEMPYINFDPTENRFYASDGCNIINGDFTATTEGNVIFQHVLSTLRMCPEIENQEAISGVMQDNKSYTVVLSKSATTPDVTILTLRNPQNKDVLTMRRSDMSFLNGYWQVVKIGDKSYDNTEMNLFFDIPAMKVHGNTGCNYFNGDIYTDPKVGASLNFGQMGVTRMACYDQGVESSMLVALEQVTSARPDSNGNALLNDSNGTTLIVLKHMDAPADE